MHKRRMLQGTLLVLALVVLASASTVFAGKKHGKEYKSKADPMMDGLNQWQVKTLYTVGESVDSYLPVGVLDGTGAYPVGKHEVRLLVSHELNSDEGKTYELANGTTLSGARISTFDVNVKSRQITAAGPAYDTVYDRSGAMVTSAAQINEAGDSTNGFDRFCSARLVHAGELGFVDTVFFANEESGTPFHAHGGTVWALDVVNETLWACPALGRGAWENVTPLDTGDDDHIALLMGDDTAGAPLYLWVGEKDADGGFLAQNGLAQGSLYVWVADNGDADPEDFNGDGSSRSGTFVEVDPFDAGMAGLPGYDAEGWLDDATLRYQAVNDHGAFAFSRPEDLHNDPQDGSRAAFASTGRGQLYPSDNWGTLYIVDLDFEDIAAGTISATIEILYDGDDQAAPDSGIRSPDNLVWAEDGFLYVQEDRSTSPGSLFGGTSGREASLWQIDPDSGKTVRIAEMDRSAVAPSDATDPSPNDIGNWESSGVLDLTGLVQTGKGKTLLLATVQAHSITDGTIEDEGLVQGGQLILIEGVVKSCGKNK